MSIALRKTIIPNDRELNKQTDHYSGSQISLGAYTDRTSRTMSNLLLKQSKL